MRCFKILVILVVIIGFISPLLQAGDKTEIPDFSMTERKDVPEEFKWRIEDIYENLDAWKKDKEKAEALIAEIDTSIQDWTASAEKMKAFFSVVHHINLLREKLWAYASNHSNMDLADPLYSNMKGELQSLFVRMNTKLSSVGSDLLELGKPAFDLFLQLDPDLEPYKFWAQQLFRMKKFVLPGEKQEIVSLTGLFSGTMGQAAGILNNVDIPHASVVLSDGSKITLNYANFAKYRASHNAEDRAIVMNAFWKNHRQFANTLASLLDGQMKQHVFNSRVHGYADTLEARLFPEAIDTQVYHSLIRATRENFQTLHRYLKLKQKLLGLETHRYEDVYASAVRSVNRVYSLDEAKKIVFKALEPLGNEYAAILKQSYQDRWMDIYPNKGKQSGAYSSGVYGVHPFVKLNFDGTYSSVSTMAHELGHALHSYLSDMNQDYENSQYTTFLAEIAATFNEYLLMDYLVKTESDDLFKLYILDGFLERFRVTVYRQTLFAEFELAMHREVEEGKSLTPEWLNAKYLALTRDYYGHDEGVMQVGDFIRNEWSRIPHFYLNYYVFQYATGMIASMALADMVLNGGEEEQQKYLGLLKAGGSRYSLDILRSAGVDMSTTSPHKAAYKQFDNIVAAMEKIFENIKNKK